MVTVHAVNICTNGLVMAIAIIVRLQAAEYVETAMALVPRVKHTRLCKMAFVIVTHQTSCQAASVFLVNRIARLALILIQLAVLANRLLLFISLQHTNVLA